MTHEGAEIPHAMQAKASQAILVIDDDEVSLAVLTVQLHAEGFRVIPAKSGELAMERVCSLPQEALPVTVLADLHMPGLSGPELAQALRKALPHAKLLAMSATAAEIDGYDAFILKPLQTSTLSAALAAWPPAPAAQEENAPALREETYAKLLQTMPPANLQDVYRLCLSDTRQRIARMQNLAAEGDLAGVRLHAHTLKGGAAMVGAARLAAAAAWLETGNYERSELLQLTHNLLTHCDELQRILQRKFDI